MRPLAVAVASLALLTAAPVEAKRFRLPKPTRQLVVVRTESWAATTGTLQRWERASEKAAWKKVGEPIAVVTGRAGLGWGLGLHPDDTAMDRPGPLKQEGDGRAPAGVFRLGDAWGEAERPPEGTTLAYNHITPSVRCVDDPKSKQYNQLVDEKDVPKSWASAEDMHRTDGLYHWVIVVKHNQSPVVPGQGSCIFVHVSPEKKPTVGCTAMDKAALETVLAWLKPEEQPLFVQLPEAEYQEQQGRWKLPADPR